MDSTIIFTKLSTKITVSWLYSGLQPGHNTTHGRIDWEIKIDFREHTITHITCHQL